VTALPADIAVRRFIVKRLSDMGSSPADLEKRLGVNRRASRFISEDRCEHFQLDRWDSRVLDEISVKLGADRSFLREVWDEKIVLDSAQFPDDQPRKSAAKAAQGEPLHRPGPAPGTLAAKLRAERGKRHAPESREQLQQRLNEAYIRIAELERQVTELCEHVYGRKAS
jgi:hypothetical protein